MSFIKFKLSCKCKPAYLLDTIFYDSFIIRVNTRESLVRAEEQAFRFNNFGSRKAFSIILFVLNRKFFVQSDAPISGIFF